MKRTFSVTLEVPIGSTVKDLTAYIRDAVACWKGQFSPDDPLFDLDPDKVKVKAVPVPKPAARS